ncbi:MAG: hypothetical protein WDW36_008399 [Sanguina aurantia]
MLPLLEACILGRYHHTPAAASESQSNWALMGVAPQYARVNSFQYESGQPPEDAAFAMQLSGKREYLPKDDTANYAFMLTLFMEDARSGDDPSWCMTKPDLMRVASDSGLCPVALISPINSHHDGWSSLGTQLCKKHRLVHKFGRSPIMVQLTPSGRDLGARMYHRDLRSLVQAINELSSRWNLTIDWNGDPDDDEFFDDIDAAGLFGIAYDRLAEFGYTLWSWETENDSQAGWMTLTTDAEPMRELATVLGINLRLGSEVG